MLLNLLKPDRLLQKTDSVKGQVVNVKSNIVQLEDIQSTIIDFTFAPLDAAQVPGLFHAQLNDLYNVSFSAGYTLVTAPNSYEVQGLKAVASNYSLTYGGPAAITARSSIVSPGTYGGTVKSIMQGSGVVENTTYSITVNAVATYGCTAPAAPNGLATCTHTLTGASSGVAGGGGSGTPPN
ncbi:hypothetical protein SAMN05216490_4983 [Mucilaginibacter mallensis]|uniref:Uncharacterized protein n=1 Tax=Mucilaginibacter mallensis TaxID=652787 RepID=A0A1H2CF71_MUCMA|nr:hypothetical protein [Mucilaginibacter mallensis]SDT69101.1 hypothetical protein SAMN05216490_4983 [Mucilaginibacter mallensis]